MSRNSRGRETDDLNCGSNRSRRSASAGSSPPSLSRKFVRLSAGGDGLELPVPRYDERSILEISSISRGRLRPGFLPDTLQDDRVPSTGETHLHGDVLIENTDEYAGDP